MKRIADDIPGYTYGTPDAALSPVTLDDLERLKLTVGWNEEDGDFLKLAGEVLSDQTRTVVLHWRSGIIAAIPHLARHFRSLEGLPLPGYLGRSNLRFEQWILDTCLRPHDQEWLNYQFAIALRHTGAKKNRTDSVRSTAHVPLSDILAFFAVINESIRPFLAAKGHSPEAVDAMHRAWRKSMHIQSALMARAYTNPKNGRNEW